MNELLISKRLSRNGALSILACLGPLRKSSHPFKLVEVGWWRRHLSNMSKMSLKGTIGCLSPQRVEIIISFYLVITNI